MDIEVVKDFPQFENLSPEWESLYERSKVRNPFLTHVWLSNWIKHFGKDRWLAVLARDIESGDLKVATVIRADGRRLGLIETHHSHYPDFLYAKGEGGRIKEILNHLKKTHNAWAIELPQRVDCSETSEFIKSIAGKRWLVLRRNPNVMRIIDIGESVESYLEGKTKKVRHELQRKKRKIEKEGFVELERLRNEADTEKLFDAMSEIERDSWKFESGTAIISSETEKSFYRNVFRIYCRESAARGYILRVDGNPVSYLIGIVYDGTLYALKTSYKETYGKFSPGTVLFLYIIELIIRDDRKINRIELLGGDARWKEELATRFQSVCTYGLYPIRISSLAFYLAYRYIRPEFRKIMGSRVWRRRPQKEPL